MQVDGPCHYTANSQRPLGPSLLKRRLMALSGWRIACVPFFEWKELRNAYERQLFLHAALQVRACGSLGAPRGCRAGQRRGSGRAVMRASRTGMCTPAAHKGLNSTMLQACLHLPGRLLCACMRLIL